MKKGLIVSCQAEEGSPFNAPQFIAAFAKAAEQGGAVAVRVRDPENVKAVAAVTELPIIALTKGSFESGRVLVTPTIADVLRLVESGADIVAFDATDRRRPGGMSGIEFLRAVRAATRCPVLADISTLHEGLAAAEAGADFVATTLSGYIDVPAGSKYEPDFALIQKLASGTRTPVIAEGRFWSPEQARKAVESGAFAVCIGSAITRPVDIVRRFVESLSGPEPMKEGG